MDQPIDMTPQRGRKPGNNVRFAAINPHIETHIVSPAETVGRNAEYVTWGERNYYPFYLLDLYNRVPTLRSVINGCTDYATGDDIAYNATARALFENNVVNRKGETVRDVARLCFFDWFLYGGFALQVIRNRIGGVAEVYRLDMRFLRMNAEGDVFYYSEKFGDKYVKKDTTIVYPAFMPTATAVTESVLYVKNTHTQVYPAPLFAASLKACETEASIDTYHLNAINNGFVSSLFVNFNNGAPEDEEKEEIEDDFCDKFSGAENAARIGFSWNESKDNATTFETFNVEDFGARYDSLEKHCRQQIFTAFRANPNLFGIPTESLGFSSEEYESAFRLFNRTMVLPAQRTLQGAFDRILGMKDSIVITPFTM